MWAVRVCPLALVLQIGRLQCTALCHWTLVLCTDIVYAAEQMHGAQLPIDEIHEIH